MSDRPYPKGWMPSNMAQTITIIDWFEAEITALRAERDRLRVALEVIRDARRRNTGPTDLTRADMREIAHTALAQSKETSK